jgi:membrane protein
VADTRSTRRALDPSTWRDLAEGLVSRDHLVSRVLRALLAVNLRDRALMLAGQAFIALIPLMIILATIASTADAQAVADWLVDRFSLTGPAEEAVDALFAKPPSASGGASILSIVVLLFSVASFARLLQRTFEVAWDLPPSRRGAVGRLGAIVVLIASVAAISWLAGLVGTVRAGWLLSPVVIFCLSAPAWWLLMWLVLDRRIGWVPLLPGACVSAAVLVAASVGSSIWMPFLIERNTARYGVVGVAIALISWLVALAFLIVASAVIGAQIGPVLARARVASAPPPAAGPGASQTEAGTADGVRTEGGARTESGEDG